MANNSAFNTISRNKMPRTAFNLTHDVKTTLNMGDLVPVFLQEVVPGDRFRIRVETMIRMMPMLAPLMHRVNIWTHFFFVPYRLIWEDWEDFITGGEDGLSLPNHPKVIRTSTGSISSKGALGYGSLADYLGIPVKNLADKSVQWSASDGFSQLPFRAYQLIYNEYYRDQNLTDPVDIPLHSSNMPLAGNTATPYGDSIFALRRRAWEKDYFTSALPWTQRGPQMQLPTTGRAPLEAGIEGYPVAVGAAVAGTQKNINTEAGSGFQLYANVDNVTSATINELRQAFQIQKWLERSARSGSRYVEFLQSFFNVNPQDGRLQRPEFLGGSKQPVMISEVLQTSESTEDSELGNFAGHGISTGSSARISRYFPEHGYVMGIMSVLPRTAYQQGMPKHFQKFDRFDHYWQEFAHIGEQEIKMQELYIQNNREANNEVFGYAPRYSEYKYIPSTVHGDFRESLNAMHMGRIFDKKPRLNHEFVEANPTRRIFNVTSDNWQPLWCHAYNNVKALRPMPVFGEPGLIDH